MIVQIMLLSQKMRIWKLAPRHHQPSSAPTLQRSNAPGRGSSRIWKACPAVETPTGSENGKPDGAAEPNQAAPGKQKEFVAPKGITCRRAPAFITRIIRHERDRETDTEERKMQARRPKDTKK